MGRVLLVNEYDMSTWYLRGGMEGWATRSSDDADADAAAAADDDDDVDADADADAAAADDDDDADGDADEKCYGHAAHGNIATLVTGLLSKYKKIHWARVCRYLLKVLQYFYAVAPVGLVQSKPSAKKNLKSGALTDSFTTWNT